MIALLIAALAAGSPTARATGVADPLDRGELRSGRAHGGRVVFENEDVVVLKQGERLRRFERDSVRSVHSRERRLGEVLDRLASLERHELPELIELGHRAHELGLPGEGELVFLRVVLTDPLNADARHALGHKRVGSAWRVPYKDDWLPLTKVADLRSEWRDAWVFETAHYELRTNLDLPTAVDVALDLEIAYRAFYEVLGRPLELHQVEDKLLAEVHADIESLPLLDEGVRGVFDESRNTLIIDASWKLDRGLLFHEITHQLLHNTHEGMQKGAHAIPLWLNEGLAEFMQVGLAVRPRSYTFDWGEYSEKHLRAQLVAPRLPTLEELLASRPSDFRSNRNDLRYALAYTLVDFCMNADSGLRQDELMAFLQEAYARRVEPEDFLTMVAKDREGFAREWAVYVEEFMQPLNVERRRARRQRGR
jgi:hypothetical protein